MPKGYPNPKPEDADIARMREEMAAELAKLKAITAKAEEDAQRAQKEDDRRREFGKLTPSAAPVMPPKPDEKLFAVRLDRNYAPKGYFEVVGYHKDVVQRKNAAGQMVTIEPAAFIEGERKPPNIAGVGFATKVWAGTVIRVTQDEARTMKAQGVGSLDFD